MSPLTNPSPSGSTPLCQHLNICPLILSLLSYTLTNNYLTNHLFIQQLQEAKREEKRMQQRQQELEHMAEMERKKLEMTEVLRKTRDQEMEQTSREIRRMHEQVIIRM